MSDLQNWLISDVSVVEKQEADGVRLTFTTSLTRDVALATNRPYRYALITIDGQATVLWSAPRSQTDRAPLLPNGVLNLSFWRK